METVNWYVEDLVFEGEEKCTLAKFEQSIKRRIF